jgi:hypothetical protein
MNVLKGIDVSPRVVGYARAVLLAVIVALIEALIKILTGESFGGDWAVYAPIAVLILRALESEADSHLKPAQNATVVFAHLGEGSTSATTTTVSVKSPADPPATPPTAPAA